MTEMQADSETRRTLAPGDFAVSKRGRDRGRMFIVTGICGPNFVLIADGRLRKIEKPKKKKLKHVSYAGDRCPGYETLTNRGTAAAIKRFCTSGGGCITNIEKE